MSACLLANANNAVVSATVSASSVLPATHTIYKKPTIRHGNGQVILSGGYTGANDSAIDIEIRPGSGSGVRVSQPVFAGAGNGVMSQPTASAGTASQDITVTLIDVGTKTTFAQAVLYGDILLRAKTAGSAGNALTLTVNPALTLSAAPIGALSFALSKDTAEWTDQRGDFGAVPLEPDGTLPANAPRLVFAQDLSRVYRHYKRWDGTQWQYGISPKLATDHAIGAPVHTVSGTYAVTLTDGVTTETYQNLITLYDLLVALSLSLRVEVVGVIANDRKPGGLAAIDVPIRSSAFVLPPVASDPQRMPGLRDLAVAANAKTETLSLTCTANTPIGSETWAVQSRVAGALPVARTGQHYSDGAVEFLIPVLRREQPPIAGQIVITQRNFPRAAGDTAGLPAICLDRPVLGAKASGQTLRLIWTARPASDCACADASVQGGPSQACLGINIDDKGVLMGDLVAAHQARLVTLYAWRDGFFTGNTELQAGVVPKVARYDLDFADLATTAFATALRDIFKASSNPPAPALAAWDAAMTGLDADFDVLEAFYTAAPSTPPDTTPEVAPSTAYAVGDVRLWPTGEWQRDRATNAMNVWVKTGTRKMKCSVAGTVGNQVLSYDAGSPPNQINDLIASGTNIFQDLTRWEPVAPVGGTSKDLSPNLGETVSDLIAQFARRYQAKMDHVRTLAGLDPKTEASIQGSECWQDEKTPYYWAIEGTAYLPVTNNRYYHSTIIGADGRPVSTEEFGFGLRVACEDRLKPGDLLIITVSNVAADYPYKIGDRYDIATVGAAPVALTGGITGTDTLTWSVVSSTAGPLPEYALTLAEPAYSGGGLSFTIHRGGLPFALGDQYRFTAEAIRQWRARRDGGAWLADAAIADSALADGLTVAFASGVAPSFESGDLYQFLVRQPHSPTHIKSAHGECWRWSGSTATLTLTWASDQVISVIGLLRHGLRAPASVVIELKDAFNAVLTTLIPTIKPGPLIVPLLATLTTVRSLTITIANALDMHLGWVYAGVPLATRHHPRVTLKRAYSIERAEGLNPRGSYLGGGRGGEIRWENWLLQAELDALLALVDACKEDGDAPMVLLPHALHPQDAALVRIETDAIAVDDYFDYQPNDAAKRRLSLTLPLAAVLS